MEYTLCLQDMQDGGDPCVVMSIQAMGGGGGCLGTSQATTCAPVCPWQTGREKLPVAIITAITPRKHHLSSHTTQPMQIWNAINNVLMSSK